MELGYSEYSGGQHPDHTIDIDVRGVGMLRPISGQSSAQGLHGNVSSHRSGPYPVKKTASGSAIHNETS